MQYEPVRIQQMSLEKSSNGNKAFITEPKTSASRNRKKNDDLFLNETLKSTSKSKLKIFKTPKDLK